MAVKATETESVTDADMKEADKLERTIDCVLRNNHSTMQRKKIISFTVNNDSDAPSYNVKKEVEKRYINAGWESVKFTHSYEKGYDNYWHLGVTLKRSLTEEKDQ